VAYANDCLQRRRTPNANPRAARQGRKNPTFHPTNQSDTTGPIRHHRTKESVITGRNRHHRTSPTVCSHLIIPRSWVRSPPALQRGLTEISHHHLRKMRNADRHPRPDSWPCLAAVFDETGRLLPWRKQTPSCRAPMIQSVELVAYGPHLECALDGSNCGCGV
jgi:hypothetical protein